MSYVFEDFELDPDCAELRRAGEPVPVEPQVFELLSLLVTSNGRLVTRDELYDHIWGNRIVSDAALSSRIRDARRALGDNGSSQRLIRTVPRRGLRFMGEAQERAAGPPETVEAPVPITREETQAPAIAILSFEDRTGESGRSLLSEGLTEEISAALCAWRHFSVVSRTTTARLQGSDLTAPEIGQTLGARYLLSGSVRRTGRKIKLNVVLTDTERDHQIWVERFSRDMTDLVDVEEEIAAQIVIALVPELESAEARRVMRARQQNHSAWDLAMLSAWQANRGTGADFDEAERLASAAARLSPDWYLPHSLIAVCRFQKAMSGFSAADSHDAFSDTMAAAKQALEVDRNSWMAHALTAVGELWTNRNHDRAIKHITRAVELNPSAPQLHHFGGCITGFSGDPVGARAFQERIFRMDPVYTYTAVIEADLGLWHMLEGDFEAADRRLARAESWDPSYGRALQRRIALAGHVGDRQMAVRAAKRMSELGLALDRKIIADSYPFRKPEHRELFEAGLKRSGINF